MALKIHVLGLGQAQKNEVFNRLMEPQSSGSLLNTEGEVTLCNSTEFFSNRKFVEYKVEVTLSNRKEGFFQTGSLSNTYQLKLILHTLYRCVKISSSIYLKPHWWCND